MITILLIISIIMIIFYLYKLFKLKRDGFSIFEDSIDFGQQKMYMEFRKGKNQISETTKGFLQEVVWEGEYGMGGQNEYQKDSSFDSNLSKISSDSRENIRQQFEEVSNQANQIENVGTYAKNAFVNKDGAFEACFDPNVAKNWNPKDYANSWKSELSETLNTNVSSEGVGYTPYCKGVAFSGPLANTPNGVYFLLGDCVGQEDDDGKTGNGDCGYYRIGGNRKGYSFFSRMNRIFNPWDLATARTLGKMNIDNVWKKKGNAVQSNIGGKFTQAEAGKEKKGWEVGVLSHEEYNNNMESPLYWKTQAEKICSQAKFSTTEFKILGKEDSRANSQNWFKNPSFPSHETHKNLSCTGYSAMGLQTEAQMETTQFSQKPKITFYSLPVENVVGKSYKNVKLTETIPGGSISRFEQTGEKTYKIFGAKLLPKEIGETGCGNEAECKELCKNNEECIGFSKNTGTTDYAMLKQGTKNISSSIQGTDTVNTLLFLNTDVYNELYSKLTSENSNQDDLLMTKTIKDFDKDYRKLLNDTMNEIRTNLQNLNTLLKHTNLNPETPPEEQFSNCDILEAIWEYYNIYNINYAKIREGDVGLFEHYIKSYEATNQNLNVASVGSPQHRVQLSAQNQSVGIAFNNTLRNFKTDESLINGVSYNIKESTEKLIEQNLKNLDEWFFNSAPEHTWKRNITNPWNNSLTYADFNIEVKHNGNFNKCIEKMTDGEVGKKTEGCIHYKFDGNIYNGYNKTFQKFFEDVKLKSDEGELDFIVDIEIKNDAEVYDKGSAWNETHIWQKFNTKTGQGTNLQCNFGREKKDVPQVVNRNNGNNGKYDFSNHCTECSPTQYRIDLGKECLQYDDIAGGQLGCGETLEPTAGAAGTGTGAGSATGGAASDSTDTDASNAANAASDSTDVVLK
jgi:hypothetical protein